MPNLPKRTAPIIQLNIEMKNVAFGNSSLAMMVLAVMALLMLLWRLYG